MKLFLSSAGVSASLLPEFLALVGKEAGQIKFALIENAADPYPDQDKGFVLETRDEFASLGMQVTLIDLRKYEHDPDGLSVVLQDFDVVWMGGGNVYYLRWLMKVSGFDSVIKQLLESGLVYGGGSAGSIITCPVLEAFDLVDSFDLAPEVNKLGLNLIDFIIIPHWQTPEFHHELEKIKDYYNLDARYQIVTITDNQAVVVNGDNWAVYPD